MFFASSKLGTKITISVSMALVLMLLMSGAVFVYYEYDFFMQNIRAKAERTLTMMEAVHIQAMLHRGVEEKNDAAIATLNGTFAQLSDTSKSMTLWLVMGPEVLGYQRRRSASEIEPPRDEIDQLAIEAGVPVARMVGSDLFRLTRPVLLGRGLGAHPACATCHGMGMGIGDGDVIGAYSIALAVNEDRDKFTTTMRGAIVISILASMVIAGVTAFLVKRLATEPISAMTGVMGRLAAGDVKIEIPGRDRGDEIGEMARSVEVFKENAISVRRHETEIAKVSRRSTMGELASSLAHELAQPLATINAYCTGGLHRLRSGVWTAEGLEEVLRNTSQMTERSNAIIRRIAAHVRGAEPHRAPIDINDIVRSVWPLVEADARSHTVQLSIELGEDLPQVLADRIEIENVILNLTRNAIDAMPDTIGGERKLVVRTSVAEDGGVEVNVRDTGSGLAPEIRDRLFEPFFTTKPEGMGMGLAICRSTVEAHGGYMRIASHSEKGTIARFVLPSCRETA